jgi:hypothetical protein
VVLEEVYIDALQRVFCLMAVLNAPMSLDKTILGSQADWAGLDCDFDKLMMELPPKKSKKFIETFRSFARLPEGKVPLPKFHSFISKLSWFAQALPALKPFLRSSHLQIAAVWRIMNKELLKRGWVDQNGAILPRKGMRVLKYRESMWVLWERVARDLQVVYKAILDKVCWRARDPQEFVSFVTDACASKSRAGVGGWFPYDDVDSCDPAKVRWFQVALSPSDLGPPFDSKTPNRAIGAYELLGTLWAIKFLVTEGGYIVIPDISFGETDNMGNVLSLGRWKCRSGIISVVLKEIAFVALFNDLDIAVRHRRGVDNELADGISRAPVYAAYEKWMDIVDPNLRIEIDVPGTFSHRLLRCVEVLPLEE